VHVSAGPGSLVNALRANAIDWIHQTPFTDTAGLSKPYVVVNNQQNAPYWVNMCMRNGQPLGNVNVRKALNYATDRNELNERVYAGKSGPAWSLFPSSDFYGNPATDNAYKYNVDKAKKMLAAEGFTATNPLKLTIITTPSGEANTISQVIQAQWAKAGVDVTIRQSTNVTAEWYTTSTTADLNPVPMIRPGVSRLTRLVTSDAFANPCKYPVPQIDALANQLKGLASDDPQAVKLWKQVQELFTNELADGVPTVWVVQAISYNADKIGGVAWQQDAIQQLEFDFTKIYVKQAK
jgi:ABC-type transport system substrate-binding protein